MRIVPLGLALFIASGSLARAEFYTGNDLYADCSDERQVFQNACEGYILGSVDALMDTGVIIQSSSGSGKVCIPNDVALGQIIDVIKQWLSNHPERRQYSATSEIDVALQASFPCHN